MNQVNRYRLRIQLEERINSLSLELNQMKDLTSLLPTCPCCPKPGLCLVDAFRGIPGSMLHIRRVSEQAKISENNLIKAVNLEGTLTELEFDSLAKTLTEMCNPKL